MTAANAPLNPAPIPASLESERRAHEPSMEEILASIRKIIADDDALPLSRPSSPPRLFEAGGASFAPPAAPAPVEEAQPAQDARIDEEPAVEASAHEADVVHAPAANFEAPAANFEAPAAVAETPATIFESPAAIEAPEVDSIEAASPASARAGNGLDESEMASFAEVGRELSRIETPDEYVEAEQGAGLRAAFDEASATFAPGEDDAEVSPVPHREVEDEPTVDDARAYEPEVSYLHAAVADDHAQSAAADAAVILSAEANASVSSAFQALSASVQMAGAESIDRHVREMLRPMLKQWLDDNLPVMVERLVRAEIERVARGGR